MLLRFISTFEAAIICGLCLLVFLPFVTGFVLRVLRGKE